MITKKGKVSINFDVHLSRQVKTLRDIEKIESMLHELFTVPNKMTAVLEDGKQTTLYVNKTIFACYGPVSDEENANV